MAKMTPLKRNTCDFENTSAGDFTNEVLIGAKFLQDGDPCMVLKDKVCTLIIMKNHRILQSCTSNVHIIWEVGFPKKASWSHLENLVSAQGSLGANSINLIDKNNGWGILSRQTEHIAHHTRTFSQVLLHKL